MNAAVKVINQKGLTWNTLSLRDINGWHMTVAMLMLAIVLTAFSIVYSRDLNRRLYSEMQVLHQQRDNLHVEWGQLLLEQSAWATQARIQHAAQSDLRMKQPTEQTMVVAN